MTNGYVYVASLNKDYYRAAKMSAESLKDFYPEANITLFTHEEWVTDEDYLIFNNIVTKDVPANAVMIGIPGKNIKLCMRKIFTFQAHCLPFNCSWG